MQKRSISIGQYHFIDFVSDLLFFVFLHFSFQIEKNRIQTAMENNVIVL